MPDDPQQANSPKSPPGMPESSMEEIIASISRIIDEDSRTPPPSRRNAAGGSEILELTEVVEADGSVRKLAGAAPAAAESPAPTPEVAADPTAAETSGVVPQPAAISNPPRDPILSAAASEAAAASFGRLGMVPRERRGEPGPLLGGADRTLEEIVRDSLHPLLRAWLDEHLPDIVERLVREEIQRVVREAGLR